MDLDPFVFTAFTEHDLLSGGATNLFVGSTLVIPTAPSVTVNVLDDDPILSGDNVQSEYSEDETGQEATAVGSDGQEIGNGGPIYGECFYWVSDSEGNQYMLVEIEQEGSSLEVFAFHSDYGTPSAGATLTVDRKVNVKDNTVVLEYDKLNAGFADPDPDPEPDPRFDYQFTAYNEFDLLPAGKMNLFVGDTISLPPTATVTIGVTDDESVLSGDNIQSEFADDTTGQTAAILDLNGQELGNGAKIFAECFYWVVDSSFNRYQMVEIEQEGTPDDYFVFHSDYGVPDTGVELYVESKVNVKNKTLVVDYNDLVTTDDYLVPNVDADSLSF